VRLIRTCKVGMKNIEFLVSQGRLSCMCHQYICRPLEAIKMLLRVYIHTIIKRTCMIEIHVTICKFVTISIGC
jgi:hypothetical protein